MSDERAFIAVSALLLAVSTAVTARIMGALSVAAGVLLIVITLLAPSRG